MITRKTCLMAMQTAHDKSPHKLKLHTPKVAALLQNPDHDPHLLSMIFITLILAARQRTGYGHRAT